MIGAQLFPQTVGSSSSPVREGFVRDGAAGAGLLMDHGSSACGYLRERPCGYLRERPCGYLRRRWMK